MKKFVVLMIVFLSMTVGQLAAQGPSQTGTIDDINQDEGYIVIDGDTFSYDDGEVSIVYRNEQVPTTVLGAGLRISYRLGQRGNVVEIVLLGPMSRLEQIHNH